MQRFLKRKEAPWNKQKEEENNTQKCKKQALAVVNASFDRNARLAVCGAETPKHIAVSTYVNTACWFWFKTHTKSTNKKYNVFDVSAFVETSWLVFRTSWTRFCQSAVTMSEWTDLMATACESDPVSTHILAFALKTQHRVEKQRHTTPKNVAKFFNCTNSTPQVAEAEEEEEEVEHVAVVAEGGKEEDGKEEDDSSAKIQTNPAECEFMQKHVTTMALRHDADGKVFLRVLYNLAFAKSFFKVGDVQLTLSHDRVQSSLDDAFATVAVVLKSKNVPQSVEMNLPCALLLHYWGAQCADELKLEYFRKTMAEFDVVTRYNLKRFIQRTLPNPECTQMYTILQKVACLSPNNTMKLWFHTLHESVRAEINARPTTPPSTIDAWLQKKQPTLTCY